MRSSYRQSNVPHNDVKLMRRVLKQFETGEKRQWPSYLKELADLFQSQTFSRTVSDKQGQKIVDEVTRLFGRILTTKLFPDIIEEMINCLSAFASSLGYYCRDLFRWMFDLYNSSISDETRVVILKSLADIIKNVRRGVKENMHNVLVKLRNALESAETIETVLLLAEVLLICGKSFPSFLQPHFTDIIDIFIGWLLDSSIPPSMVKPLDEVLLSLKYFWLQNIHFSSTLLSQFLEDFENNYRELLPEDESGLQLVQLKSPNARSRVNQEKLSSNERILSMSLLIKLYITVLKCLGKFSDQDNPHISWDFLMSSLQTFIKCVNTTPSLRSSEELIIAINECTHLTLQSFQAVSNQSKDLILETGILYYIKNIQDYFPGASYEFIVTSLKLMTTVVKQLGMDLPIEFVTSVFSANSYCQKLRFLSTDRVQQHLFILHHSILSVKSVPILEEAYRCLLLDLNAAFFTLLNKNIVLSEDEISEINEKNGNEMTIKYNKEEAVLVIQSTLVSLAEIANMKHSIILMYALKPTFFDLLVHRLDPAEEVLVKKFKIVQYALLYILYSHSAKHGHFLASSSLLTQQSVPFSSFGSTINTPSSTHLANIIQLLSDVLKNSALQPEIRLLCVSWAHEIVNLALPNLQLLSGSDKMKQLIDRIADLAFNNNTEICLLSASFIETILKHVPQLRISSAIEKYDRACRLHIGNTNQDIQQAFLQLYAIIPSSLTAMKKETNLLSNPGNKRDAYVYPEDIRLAINALMKRDSSSTFTTFYFCSIISFILDNEQPKDRNWLQRMFHCCLSEDNPIKIITQIKANHTDLTNSDVVKIFDASKTALIFWACWEVAQFCITNRLRTPLGKPIETLTRIETAIKYRVEQIYSSSGDKKESLETKADCSLQVRMLLSLMENLEKLIYIASEGNSTKLYQVQKHQKTFFTNNKKSCAEWINRNRKSLMLIALKCGEPAAVVRHGQELLREMLNKTPNAKEIEFIFLLIVEALIELESPDAIMGLYIWAKQVLGFKFLWIKAAAEEANCHFENALEEYKSKECNFIIDSLLEETTSPVNNGPKNYLKDFINNRIVTCYLNIGKVQEAIEWNNQASFNQNLFSPNFDLKYLQDLAVFPDNDEHLFEEVKGSEKVLSWDLNLSYHEAQKALLSTCILQIANPDKDYINKLETLIEEKINPLISVPIWCGFSKDNYFINILHRTATAIKLFKNDHSTGSKNVPLILNLTDSYLPKNSAILVNAMSWCKMYQQVVNNNNLFLAGSINELNYLAAKCSRKQQNLNLAQRLLFEYAEKTCKLNADNKDIIQTKANQISDFSNLTTLINQAASIEVQNKVLINFQLEGTKLIYSFGDARAAIDSLLNCITNLLGKSESNPDFLEILSRSLLTLVKYLQTDMKYCEHINSLLHPALTFMMNRVENLTYCEESIEQSENLIGKLLLFSVNSSPSLAKSWYALGAWSYRWGRKLADIEEEKFDSRIISKEDNAFAFYKLSASSYFKFLQISNRTGCDDVNATLRLLRLILKHAPEMREILEEGLLKTPTEPWKNIILQLFSRIHHPEQYVRQSISDLLCRIGQDSPQLIIFPAVAGSLTNKKEDIIFEENSFSQKAKSLNDEDFDNENEDIDEHEAAIMQNCYSALVETLSHQSPKLINQTKVFVNELRRITVLWDEVWIGTLMNHLGEMKKQVVTLENEISKIRLNSLLNDDEKEIIIREKYSIIFKRVIYFLELTQTITSEEPGTPHETWFQRNFSKAIASTIKTLKSPACPSQPQQSLTAYQQLLHLLQKKAVLISSGRSQLVMDYISPVLANMEKTEIPMPGLNVHSENSKIVTIQKVCKTVTTLHTKTKPKKIILYGSDGKPYTYLFKGHEDLHLDERIMQFLAIVNKMLVKYNKSRQDNAQFNARHYAVTPLGNKSGLIQWVDGGQALYGLYKRWILNRDSGDLKNKQGLNNENVYKPSEIFSKKLASKGIISANRNDWPPKVLIQVLQELMQETPKDLIAKELWCASLNAHDYWRLMQRFTFSNAVMCMIGYIIGLGDRHLDNILLDLSTGEIIHIDYNICFEKGKTLRVPERVACRLTQNIVNAFGITGVEGTFRVSCEQILRVLRKGKETLLTLLEAFVYDPLIDWTPGHEEGYTGAVYGGARINDLLKEGKIISKQQMEQENAEALARLNVMINNIEKRSNWPKISDGTEHLNIVCQPESEFQELKRIVETNNSKNLFSGTIKASDKKSGKGTGVKKNTYATSVWKKIKMKLDGRDPDPNKRYSVIEQVNNVLKEAMDVENLAFMYEGWTSWV